MFVASEAEKNTANDYKGQLFTQSIPSFSTADQSLSSHAALNVLFLRDNKEKQFSDEYKTCLQC